MLTAETQGTQRARGRRSHSGWNTLRAPRLERGAVTKGRAILNVEFLILNEGVDSV